MQRRRLLVIEANEVPLRVLRTAVDVGRAPNIARVLARGTVLETEVREDLPRQPYPSQTWASLSTGVPWERHGVWWYVDHKTPEFPLYWQAAAAAGRSVGLVGSLHSSPLASQCPGPAYRFVIPDSFAADAETVPATYRAFQRFNLRMTRRNSRTSRLRFEAGDAGVLAVVPRLGLRAATLREVARTVAMVKAKRIPAERLRSVQTMVLSDLFFHLTARHDPDLAVLFTNHVAAAMHRYWYALYPHDFDQEHYDEGWVTEHRDEIPAAVELLDGIIERAADLAERTDRTLVLVSSMGQGPSPVLDATTTSEAVIRRPEEFLAAVGVTGPYTVVGSMHPQLSVQFRSGQDARAAVDTLSGDRIAFKSRLLDVRDRTVTLTYELEDRHGELIVDGRPTDPARLGVHVEVVRDHSSGRHTPFGSLIIHNSPEGRPPVSAGAVDALEFAPALLRHLGLEPLPHHIEPTFRL
jgi:hypothetical protein